MMEFQGMVENALYAIEHGCSVEYVGLGDLFVTPYSAIVALHAHERGYHVEERCNALIINHLKEVR